MFESSHAASDRWRARSMRGLAMNCEVQPPVGTLVTVGSTRAQILRHFQGGMALEFMRPIQPASFDENVTI